MNTKNLEINQSKMISVFASEQFYGSANVYFRELLMNAYDACFTKQALQWSWGTEFLEEEQAKLLNSARKTPYVPKIVISYDSRAHLLSFSDNGIGMNEHDLVEYVGKLGESFYTSKEYKDQKLKYDPISRHGIGLCSCFMVARAVLIESKKDKAINTAWNIMNQQQLDAVMVKWFGDGRQLEYVKSNRKEAGTKITLPLMPHAEHLMSMEYMIKAIEHYVFYPAIPITLVCDGVRKTLYQSRMVWKTPFSNVLGITTIMINNDLMEGYLAIYNDRHKELFLESELWQQNFRLVENIDSLKLKPNWLQNFTFRLNLKRHLLNQTMSKNDIIRDKMWWKFREEVGNILIRHFNKSPINLAKYIANGDSLILSEYEEENELLSRAIPVQVYIKEQEIEVPLRTVIHGFHGKAMRCAVMAKDVFYFYRENYPHDFRQTLGEVDVVVFEKNAQAFMQFLSPYIEVMDYQIGETPGVIYTDIKADLTTIRNLSAHLNEVELYPDGCSVSKVFCFVDNTRGTPFEIILNPYNRNARLLEDAMEHDKVSNLVAVIIENVKRRIVEGKIKWDKIIDFGGTIMEDWYDDKAISLKSAFCLESDFPDKLNDFIAEKFSEGELNRFKLRELKFTREDFISWWFPH